MNKSIILFSICYIIILLCDWGARFVPYHFGYHAAHFYMLDQVGEKTRYYRKNTVYDQNIHGYLSSLLGIEHYKYYHHQRMTTDGKGLRKSCEPNPQGICPVTVLGDSFIFGSYNSDEDILSAKLQERLQVPVRNLAFPGNAVIPMIDLLRGKEKLSPLIIWGLTERGISKESFALIENTDKPGAPDWEKAAPATYGFERFKEWFAVHSKDSFTRYFANSIWTNIKFYLFHEISKDLWTPLHQDMLFFREGIEKMGQKADAAALDMIAGGAEKLVQKASSRGAEVLILLIPDKCTIYPEYISDPQRQENLEKNRFLDHIETAFKSRNLHVINLRPIFAARKAEGLLYFPDDTHWNPKGINIAAEAIAAYLNLNVSSTVSPFLKVYELRSCF